MDNTDWKFYFLTKPPVSAVLKTWDHVFEHARQVGRGDTLLGLYNGGLTNIHTTLQYVRTTN